MYEHVIEALFGQQHWRLAGNISGSCSSGNLSDTHYSSSAAAAATAGGWRQCQPCLDLLVAMAGCLIHHHRWGWCAV